jgi:hypothetical protein
MTTTIKISEEKRKRLFHLKSKLENEWGRKLSYDDIIGILVDKLENIQSTQLVKDLQSLMGILSNQDKSEFKRMREIDRKYEERFTSD